VVFHACYFPSKKSLDQKRELNNMEFDAKITKKRNCKKGIENII
jgi:hypothetical protein